MGCETTCQVLYSLKYFFLLHPLSLFCVYFVPYMGYSTVQYTCKDAIQRIDKAFKRWSKVRASLQVLVRDAREGRLFKSYDIVMDTALKIRRNESKSIGQNLHSSHWREKNPFHLRKKWIKRRKTLDKGFWKHNAAQSKIAYPIKTLRIEFLVF